jgi:hypothetical protein
MIDAHDRPKRGAQPRGDFILPAPLVDEDEGDVRPDAEEATLSFSAARRIDPTRAT